MQPWGRPPFLPWSAALAGHLAQLRPKQLLGDAGALQRALSDAHRLFGYDGIQLPLDETVEAEALGCAIVWRDDAFPRLAAGGAPGATARGDLASCGRLPVWLEAARRLVALGGSTPVVAPLVGPVSLCARLRDNSPAMDDPLWDETQEAVVTLARAWAETRVWGVVVVESATFLGAVEAQLEEEVTAALEPVWNVLRYYRVHPFLQVLGRTSSGVVEWGARRPVDGVATTPPPEVGACPRGIALSTDAALGGPVGRPAGAAYLTTDGELVPESPVEAVQELCRAMCA